MFSQQKVNRTETKKKKLKPLNKEIYFSFFIEANFVNVVKIC